MAIRHNSSSEVSMAEQEHQWPASEPLLEEPINHTTLQHQLKYNKQQWRSQLQREYSGRQG